MKKSKKLLLVSSNSIHTFNFYCLVKDYFSEILIITDIRNDLIPVEQVEFNFSIKNPVCFIKCLAPVKKIISDFNPDIVHCHQANTATFAVLLSYKIKSRIVFTAWGSDILVNPYKNRFYRYMVKYILMHCSYFTSDSVYMAEKMSEFAKKKLDILIANFGIDIVPCNRVKEDIIYSNRLHNPLYRIDKIIYAFHLFSKNNPTWKLVVAAVGSETEKVKLLVNRLGIEDRVSFPGWIKKEINEDFYCRAKVYVSIPESDATSISLLEAMSAGCLPILSDLQANCEWITNGKNGIILKDVESDFFQQVISFTSDYLIVNKQIVLENASKKANSDKYISLYNRIN